MKFRKIPVEVEAIRFTGRNATEVKLWVNNHPHVESFETWFLTRSMTSATGNQAWRYIKDDSWDSSIVAAVYDYLHDTWVGMKIGQWIIRGTKGELYPCEDNGTGQAPLNYEQSGSEDE